MKELQQNDAFGRKIAEPQLLRAFEPIRAFPDGCELCRFPPFFELPQAERIELLPPDDTRSVFVEVLHDGKSYSEEGFEMDHLLPTPEKIIAKFRHLTATLPAGQGESLLDGVMNLEKLASVRTLTELLRGI